MSLLCTKKTSLFCLCFSVSLLLTWTGNAFSEANKVAQNRTEKATSTKSTAKNNRPSNNQSWMTPEREAAALTFVRQHHPELEQLLVSLKEHSSQQYLSAIKELHRNSERLAVTRERNSKLYNYQLSSWKYKSRIQLLSAQIQMNPGDKKLKAELKEVLTMQINLQRDNLQAEYEKSSLKTQKIKEQLDRINQNQDELIQKQFDAVVSVTKNKNRSAKSGTSDTSKNKKTTTNKNNANSK